MKSLILALSGYLFLLIAPTAFASGDGGGWGGEGESQTLAVLSGKASMAIVAGECNAKDLALIITDDEIKVFNLYGSSWEFCDWYTENCPAKIQCVQSAISLKSQNEKSSH
tara:strand:- start:48839 stop:49171 length:333 start_codon:yes stop_codon:yes gene_type:complete